MNNETTNATETVSTEEANKAGLIIAPIAPVKPIVEFEDGAEDDFLYGEDEKGNSLKGQPLAAKATTRQPVKFATCGEKHTAEIIFGNVTYATRRAPTDIATKMTAEAGINDASDDIAKSVDFDRKIQTDATYQGARVALALEATARDTKGNLRVSVPFLRGISQQELTSILINPERDMIKHSFARSYVTTVLGAIADFFN